MAKSENSIPMEIFASYQQLIYTHPAIEIKGKTMPYTSVNGYKFSFLDKSGKMGLRLGKRDLEEFLGKFNTQPMEQYGRLMKEYAEVPADLLKDTATLSEYLKRSYDYVSNLKPKPAKKEK